MLTDEFGAPAGTGRRFGIRLYDAGMNHIANIVVTANGDEAVISGLPGGTSYYIAEDVYAPFEAVGIEAAGVRSVSGSAVGIVIPAIADGDTLEIRLTVTNRVTADDLLNLIDEEPPFGPYPKPGPDVPLIDIPYEAPPFGPGLPEIPITGDYVFVINMLFFAAAAAGMLLMARYAGKSKERA